MPANINRPVSDVSGAQSRGPFQRSHSTPNSNATRQVTISEVTRSKLNQLKYKPKNSRAADVDSENHSVDPSEPTLPPNNPASALETPSKWNTARRNLGDIEEEPSPHDRISWNTDLTALERSASQGTPLRNRKRAASSSPTQSPYPNKRDGESTTFRKLAAASKALADPTLELWDRYALHAEGLTGGSPLAQPMSEFLVSSSPQPHRDLPKVGPGVAAKVVDQNLRRSLAKASGVKRRRVVEPTRASLLRKDESTSTSGNSLVDVFLSNAYSGSLFQGTGGSEKQPVTSPALAPGTQKGFARSKSENAAGFLRRGASPNQPPSTIKENNSSDEPKPPLQNYIPDQQQQALAAASVPASVNIPQSSQSAATVTKPTSTQIDMDEFEILDEDMFDDDLDDSLLLDLADKVEDAPAPAKSIPTSIPAHVTSAPSLQRHVSAPAAAVAWTQYTNANPQAQPPRHTSHEKHQAQSRVSGSDEYGDDEFNDAELNFLYDSTQKPADDAEDGGVQAQGNGRHGQQYRQPPQKQTEFTEDDEFGDLGDLSGLDLDAEFATASQALGFHEGNTFTPINRKPRVVRRMKVTEVHGEEYTVNGCTAIQKAVTLELEQTHKTVTVLLREAWAETLLEPGIWAHVVGKFSDGVCIVDMKHNYFILEPDHLVSITTLADAFSCMRKAVMQDRVRATGVVSKPMVYGTMLHEIFQEALMRMDFSSKVMEKVTEKVVQEHLEDLFTATLEPGMVKEELRGKMAAIRQWSEKFISPVPKNGAKVMGLHNRNPADMCISKLLDVEEHVWSPNFGLKGNIDATVQVSIHDKDGLRTLTVPFEVKTGKNESINHRAQTTMYTMLLSDRYDIDIVTGMLYYTETGATKAVPALRNELVHMIMRRNELSDSLRRHDLPPMAQSPNTCRGCFAKTECAIFHKLAENGSAETTHYPQDFNKITGNLSAVHQEFFKKWDELLTLEEKHGEHAKREIWSMTSAEREHVHRAFSDCIIKRMEEKPEQRFSRYHYWLGKAQDKPTFSFTESTIGMGDPIVVSDEEGHFALAIGYVQNIGKKYIHVAVDRRLHNQRIRQAGFDAVDNQVFAGINEVVPEGVKMTDPTATAPEPVRYRLDKDEFGNGMARVRNNLVSIMNDDSFGARKVRELVVDLREPTFKPDPTQYEVNNMEALNEDQRAAIAKVMSAQDYALVLGMPGTGKTTTIAQIIRALVRQKKSVLLTSYTHSAVDNILLKLTGDGIPVFRVGNRHTMIHDDVASAGVVTLSSSSLETFEAIKTAWIDSPIVATTCLGINHPVFSIRTFDYCIVDEASQITLPVCLGPIQLAKTFVLVGDHYQLPPVVQNEQARVGGLDVSMFKLLSDNHPESVVNLVHQYRMCEDIMSLSNELIYRGQLKCGTEALKTQMLHVPDIDALAKHHYKQAAFPLSLEDAPCPGTPECRCWLQEAIKPETRACFLSTDNLGEASRETNNRNRIINEGEVTIVAQLVESLLSVGIQPEDIGVMTHYRAQLALLKKALKHHEQVEMYTADRFQGRDKEVVVLSLVRSNDAHAIGDLLKDWRRINVAITRAKTKLLVVGSRETILGAGADVMVAKFVRLMDRKGWVAEVPARALVEHFFEVAPTTQWELSGFSPKKASPVRQKAIAEVLGMEKGMKIGSEIETRKNIPVRGGGNSKVMDFFGKGKVKENGSGNGNDGQGKKEGPRRIGMSGRLVAKRGLITRDILNELSGGKY